MGKQLGFPHPLPPLSGGEGARGPSLTVSSLILGPISGGREVASAICQGGHW
jgi:hypothetical protein